MLGTAIIFFFNHPFRFESVFTYAHNNTYCVRHNNRATKPIFYETTTIATKDNCKNTVDFWARDWTDHPYRKANRWSNTHTEMLWNKIIFLNCLNLEKFYILYFLGFLILKLTP